MQICDFNRCWQTVLLLLTLLVSFAANGQRQFSIASPDKKLSANILVSDSLRYELLYEGKQIVKPSAIAMLTDHGGLGIAPAIASSSTRSEKQVITNSIPYKRKEIPDVYNEITMRFRQKFSLVFRLYNDGAAYRFLLSLADSVTVINEVATLSLPGADSVYFPQVQKRDELDIFHTSFEEPYRHTALLQLKTSDVAFTPVLVTGNPRLIITESDLIDYPGMFLRGTSGGLAGLFAPYPAREKVFGGEFKQPMVVERKNFIANTSGKRAFPWRVIGIAVNDADLLTNDLVYRLASPPRGNFAWVKPGMSTEEWIVGINLHNVDFKAGLNTASYKYYIDFASKMGMQYVMLDAGWSDPNDLFKIAPGMNLEELAAYSKNKNISLIFWTLSMTLDRQLDTALEFFSRLNCKVIMTDFMDRDDQPMVNFYHRVARAAASKEMMVMFHGAFKNAGFERTWPNSIAREGVLGSEYNIWSTKATPEHDLILPFTRMVSGPMDYEPGFMVNVNKQTFKPNQDMLMSMGTRCHQLAMFVVYESPLQLFSGNPSDALKEPEYMSFLAGIPTTWDDIQPLEARIGKYVAVARRSTSTGSWYIGAMTDWTPRTFEADLSFLGPGNFVAEICEDGINAARYGSDYRFRTENVTSSSKLKIEMAPGGGYVAKITRQ
jgi:alpha-glucosidase